MIDDKDLDGFDLVGFFSYNVPAGRASLLLKA